ncbi:MAG: 16S rRNA (adenine(1518)-N(6)/adenine(1519)-N(6))-dimethyltransferase RsmA [Patescibacteria group bacterium]
MKKKQSIISKRRARAKRPPLGQHFLTSARVLTDIIRAAHVRPGELILEIGPGKGVLTRALLASGARVIAIERDEMLAGALSKEFAGNTHFTLITGDAIEILEQGSVPELRRTSYAVIANIPYAITGRLFRLLWSHASLPAPTRTVVLVQKEVADRMMADIKKGTGMNLLGLATHCYGNPAYISTVPKGAFQPPPNVLSAIIAITKHVTSPLAEARIEHLDDFFDIARTAFQQKRKQLHTSLKLQWPKAGTAKEKSIEKYRMRRPETLSLADWMNLYQGLQKH